MKAIVFLGDSITDTGRVRTSDESMGAGYALMVSAHLGLEYPGQYVCYNKGVNNDRITDLYARVKRDVLNYKPDILSILVGVNDVWRETYENDGVDAEKYAKMYSMLIEEIKAALPDVRIIIMEPFVLKTDFTGPYWEYLSAEVPKRAQKAKELAEKYGLYYVPLQEKFDELVKLRPNKYWLKDGVHPSLAGHEVLKREWLKAFHALEGVV